MMNACPRRSLLVLPLLAALGCSSPAPLPAQGGVTVSIHQPDTAVQGMMCPISPTQYQMGDPAAPTTISAGDRLIDGQKGASITCSVQSNGSNTFSFSGNLHAVNTKTTPSQVVTINFDSGTIAANGTGTANVLFLSNGLSGSLTSPSGTPCTLTVVPPGTPDTIKGGSIWASFNCPSITSTPSNLCGLSGVFVFENCAGSPQN
jgi:hypothetical protein